MREQISLRLLSAGLAGALAVAEPGTLAQERSSGAARAPLNVVVAIADDWSWPHTGADGDPAARTPTYDRLAREGVRFTHAFTAAPSCTPSRAALLTGQAPHRLAEGAQLWSHLPSRFAVYPDLLEARGYLVGHTGKGWGPGSIEPGGRTRNPAGPRYASFPAFLATRTANVPFAYWFGSSDPHRPYEVASGARAGVDPARVRVPAFLPDTPEVRSDVADYLAEVERFDRDLGALVAALEGAGELDRTLLIVTSDNGMPFPGAKATLYDGGTRVPLVIRWPGVASAGHVSDAIVTLTDLAPTILKAAGLDVPVDMTGLNLRPVLEGRSGEAERDMAFLERERHANVRAGDLSYPSRAARSREYLYVRNFRPDRWPAGDPVLHHSVGPFGDIDDGPSKQLLMREGTAFAAFRTHAMAKRPAEELYVVAADPGQLHNVAQDPAHAPTLRRLRDRLATWMSTTGDPRATSDDDRYDRYPYYGPPLAVPPRVPAR
ncbi:sulfatase [Luteitalea pratensis]|nr:sulfatase [Luteitalea pratensis]